MKLSRQFLALIFAGVVVPGVTTSPISAAYLPTEEQRVARLQEKGGGRLGVSALDTKTGERLSLNGDDRFLLCSTFKLLLAALCLKKSDEGSLNLKESIKYTSKAIVGYSPITQKHLKEGSMTVEELCAATVDYSDNGAANLLIEKTGGLKAFNAFVHLLGDKVTRLDRMEPELNADTGADALDTTTPNAMLKDMRKLLTGNVLKPESRETLRKWLIGNTTGNKRLRAGVPKGWKVGDKTGTGEKNAINDIAIIWTDAGCKTEPIFISVYTIGAKVSQSEQEQMIADVADIVCGKFNSSRSRH